MSDLSPFEARRKNRPRKISAGFVASQALQLLLNTAYVSGRLKKLAHRQFTKPKPERHCAVSAQFTGAFVETILSPMIQELGQTMKAGKVRPCGNAEALVREMPKVSRAQHTETGVELAVGLEPGETTKIVLAVCG